MDLGIMERIEGSEALSGISLAENQNGRFVAQKGGI
jgi:hypothetical protein